MFKVVGKKKSGGLEYGPRKKSQYQGSGAGSYAEDREKGGGGHTRV